MIDSFTGKNSFLSNFYPVEIEYEGIKYPSVEHAYQAAKTLDMKKRVEISQLVSPANAKKAGKRLKIRDNWEILKLPIMCQLVNQKFKNSDLKQKLLDTGEEDLIEGNWWGDTYWGVCRGEGDNNLGKILMYIRKRAQEKLESKNDV